MTTQQETQEDYRCRFCLAKEVNELIPVFCIASTQKILIAHMALACTGNVISCRDKLPQYICDVCLGNLDIAYACWKRCRLSWGNYKRHGTLDVEGEDYRCRICLKDEVEELISLLCICDSQLMKIGDIIQRFSGLNVTENDKFPQYICDVCLAELNTGYNFRKLTRMSNATLRSNAIEAPVDKKFRKKTDNSPETSLDNSNLSEFLNFRESPKTPLPKIRTSVSSSTEKNAKEVKPPVSVKIIQKPKVIPPPPTLDPVKKIGRQTLQLPGSLSINNKNQAPKITSSTLQSTAIVPKKITQAGGPPSSNTVTAVRSPSPNAKKASFSNPAEFKMLASRILKKPIDVPSPTPVVPEILATLVVNEHTIINRKTNYTWSQITAFECKNCENVCSAAAIRKTCIKCKLRFDNHLPIESERKAAQQGSVGAYCCKHCTFFTVTLSPLIEHLTVHNKPDTSKRTVTKNSEKSDVPQSQLNEPVSNKRCADKSPIQSSTPVTKKQRPEEKSTPKPPNAWVKVEQSCKIPGILRIPRALKGIVRSVDDIMDTDSDNDSTPEAIEEPVVSSKDAPALTVEVVTDSEPEVQDESAEVLEESNEQQEAVVPETDVKLEHDPLDIVDTADDVPMTITSQTTQLNQDDAAEVSSNEDFAGFEETDPSPLSLDGGTLDTNFFETLIDTREYLMLFLKGFICFDCVEPFELLEQLRRHRTYAHSKPQSNLSSETNAEDHRLLNSKRIFYYCKLCQSLLLSEEDFHGHRESYHTSEQQLLSPLPVPGVYDVILSKLNKKLSLRNVENNIHFPNPFKMTENETIFKTLKETNHYKLLFMKGELCCGCQEWYSSNETLQAHCANHHAEDIEPENTAQCELCHADCRTDSRLIRHQLQRVRRLYYFCKLCHEVLVHHADDYHAHQAVAHGLQLKPQSSIVVANVEMLIFKDNELDKLSINADSEPDAVDVYEAPQNRLPGNLVAELAKSTEDSRLPGGGHGRPSDICFPVKNQAEFQNLEILSRQVEFANKLRLRFLNEPAKDVYEFLRINVINLFMNASQHSWSGKMAIANAKLSDTALKACDLNIVRILLESAMERFEVDRFECVEYMKKAMQSFNAAVHMKQVKNRTKYRVTMQ